MLRNDNYRAMVLDSIEHELVLEQTDAEQDNPYGAVAPLSIAVDETDAMNE
jgi:hypothetical protein